MLPFLRSTATPTEGVVKVSPSTEALVGTTSHGSGTLYVTEQIITWKIDGGEQGFSIPYRRITCHAISRDGSMHPSPCLYVMINGNLEDDNEEMDMNEADDDEDDMTEIFFIPPDAPTLDLLYKAIEECSLLHPDPSSDMSDDSDINEGFEPAGLPEEDEEEDEEVDNLPPAQQLANLQAYLAARLQIGRAGGDAEEADAAGGGGAGDVILPSSNGNGIGSTPPEDMSDDGNPPHN